MWLPFTETWWYNRSSWWSLVSTKSRKNIHCNHFIMCCEHRSMCWTGKTSNPRLIFWLFLRFECAKFVFVVCSPDQRMKPLLRSFTRHLRTINASASPNCHRLTLQFVIMLEMWVWSILWFIRVIALQVVELAKKTENSLRDLKNIHCWSHVAGNLSDWTFLGQKQRLCYCRTSSALECFSMFFCFWIISTFGWGVFQ